MKYLLKLLSRLRLMPYLNLMVRTKGIIIPIVGGVGYANYYSTEEWMSQVLKILFDNTKDCFIDVGVNIGQTLIKVRSIEKEMDYIGFEPNPVCINYIDKLIEANKYQNCKIIPAGISDNNQIAHLKLFDSHHPATDPMASIIEDFKDQAITEKNVIIITGDVANTVLPQKTGIIKIDVEGSELYVIKEFAGIIERDRPFILVEILPAYTKDSEYPGRISRQKEILEYLEKVNYSIFNILKNDDNSFKNFILIKDFGRQTDSSFSDYLCIPFEKKQITNHN